MLSIFFNFGIFSGFFFLTKSLLFQGPCYKLLEKNISKNFEKNKWILGVHIFGKTTSVYLLFILANNTDWIGYNIWTCYNQKKYLLYIHIIFTSLVWIYYIFCESLIFSNCIICFGKNVRTKYKRDWNIKRIHS